MTYESLDKSSQLPPTDDSYDHLLAVTINWLGVRFAVTINRV